MGFGGKYKNISVVLKCANLPGLRSIRFWVVESRCSRSRRGKAIQGTCCMLTQGQPLLSWVPVPLFQTPGSSQQPQARSGA